jgi:hypothetical protein
VVGEAGIEPTTPGLEGRCSIQLSYSPTLFKNESRVRFETDRGRVLCFKYFSVEPSYAVATQAGKAPVETSTR